MKKVIKKNRIVKKVKEIKGRKIIRQKVASSTNKVKVSKITKVASSKKKSATKGVVKMSNVGQRGKSKVVKKTTKVSVKLAKKVVQGKKKLPPVKKKVLIPAKVVSKIQVSKEKVSSHAAGDDYMSAKQLEYFRSILLRWKRQIMEEVDNTKNHMRSDVVNYPDPIDRANHEEEFSLELRTRDRERKLIYKIDDALSRINDGDYGYCDACGAEIGTKRLEARPTATQCIECKKIAEVKERQNGEGVV